MASESSKLDTPHRAVERLEARFTARPDKLARYLFSFIDVIKQLRAHIKAENPDLIHANSTRAGLVSTAASIGTQIPVIWHLQDELPRHPFSSLIRLFALFARRVRLMPASAATGASFRGRLLKIFAKHLPERVVHNAVELEDFRLQTESRANIRRELNLREDEIVFGIVGQITPRKGQLELLRTFAAAKREIGAAKLLVVGAPMFNQDHVYLEKLEQTARELKIEQDVIFLGARGDIAAIMQSLDALVINSKSEALVVVAVEALVCRTPVIATNVGGTAEIIKHGTTGWLVSGGDDNALRDALVMFARQPELRRKFAGSGEIFAAERLNAEYFIRQIEGFYEECAAGNGSAENKNATLQKQPRVSEG